MDYPTPELLAKIAEVATTFRDFQRTAAPYNLNSTTTNIKDMMSPETFELPMDWDQMGSQLYRRIVTVFGLTPTTVRKLHMERHFSKEDVDKHINYFNDKFGTEVTHTKKGHACECQIYKRTNNSIYKKCSFHGSPSVEDQPTSYPGEMEKKGHCVSYQS